VFDVPLTKTWTGIDAWPLPIGEYGVHTYRPSSVFSTDRMNSVPCGLVRRRRPRLPPPPPMVAGPSSSPTITPFFAQTMIVTGGLASTGQSMRPLRPRVRKTRGGSPVTRGRSTTAQKTATMSA